MPNFRSGYKNTLYKFVEARMSNNRHLFRKERRKPRSLWMILFIFMAKIFCLFFNSLTVDKILKSITELFLFSSSSEEAPVHARAIKEFNESDQDKTKGKVRDGKDINSFYAQNFTRENAVN